MNAEIPVTYPKEMPPHVQAVIEEVTLCLYELEASEVANKFSLQVTNDHPPFILAALKIKENLGTRVLWLNGKLKFSNGATREMKFLFHAMDKGVYLDIQKQDVPDVMPFVDNDDDTVVPVGFAVEVIGIK